MNRLPASSRRALEELLSRDDPDVLGVVLSGSAARDMATEWSDVDVYVIRREGAATADVRRSAAIDEIQMTLGELEKPASFGTDGWWARWSFAWAEVLRDEADGRIASAVRRQATLTAEEQDAILPERLDGYINFVYRALKADRENRPLERRLDAAESVPWMLDVIFWLSGRVRPYNKYLGWELRHHPLGVDAWSADVLLPQLEDILDGRPAALRAAFASVAAQCLGHDRERRTRPLIDTIDGWGQELALLAT